MANDLGHIIVCGTSVEIMVVAPSDEIRMDVFLDSKKKNNNRKKKQRFSLRKQKEDRF